MAEEAKEAAAAVEEGPPVLEGVPVIPLVIQPCPVPTAVNLGSAQAPDGSPLIVIQIHTPAGVGVYFLPRENALELASAMRKQAQQGPKLLTPPKGLLVPNR